MSEESRRWFLTGIGGSVNGREFVLVGKEISLGRSRDNAIVITGNNISRRHAAISFRDTVCWIRDLGSKNGTYINEKQTTESPLVENDILRLGECRFRVGVEQPTQGEVETPPFFGKGHEITESIKGVLQRLKKCVTMATKFLLPYGNKAKTWIQIQPSRNKKIYVGILALILLLVFIWSFKSKKPQGSPRNSSDAPIHSGIDPVPASEETVAMWRNRAQNSLNAGDLSVAVSYLRKIIAARPEEKAIKTQLIKTEARLKGQITQHYERGVREFEKLYYEKAINEWHKVLLLSEDFDREMYKKAEQRIRDATEQLKKKK